MIKNVSDKGTFKTGVFTKIRILESLHFIYLREFDHFTNAHQMSPSNIFLSFCQILHICSNYIRKVCNYEKCSYFLCNRIYSSCKINIENVATQGITLCFSFLSRLLLCKVCDSSYTDPIFWLHTPDDNVSIYIFITTVQFWYNRFLL